LYLLSQKESDQQTTLFAVGMQNDNKSWWFIFPVKEN
jgi:hypothetical protein